MSHIKWKDNFEPDIILKKIQAVLTLESDTTIKVSAYLDYIEARTVIFTMLIFPENLSARVRNNLLNEGIRKTFVEGDLDHESLLKKLNDILRSLNSNREEEYHLLTSLSLNSFLESEIEVSGCKINIFNGDFPEKYNSRYEEDLGALIGGNLDLDHTPPEYVKVIVTTKAKNPYDASHTSLFSLDTLRAFMCLIANLSQQFFLQGPINKIFNPINKITLGGIHSLHRANGDLEEYYYEPNYQKQKIYSFDSDQNKRIFWSLEELGKSSYDRKLRNALVKYARAFDERDKNAVILKGWGVLESLAAPHKQDNYEEIVRRCSSLFEDRAVHRQILEHIREHRNLNIHAGEYIEDATIHCYQLQYYIRALILFHLKNHSEFKGLDNVNQFLDLLDRESTYLENMRDLYKKAIDFKDEKLYKD